MPSNDSIYGVESPGGRWKRERLEKIRKDTTGWNREVCNTFQNVVVILIITSFYINFGTSTNVFKNLIRLSDTYKATKARIEKIGQHKLGPGGYSNLATRYVGIVEHESASKYHIDYYFCFVLEKNVKLMTSCKYEGRSVQRIAQCGLHEAWLRTGL